MGDDAILGVDHIVLGIDPGTTETGFAMVGRDTLAPLEADKLDNVQFLQTLPSLLVSAGEVVVEGIQSYGQAFGKTVIETCYVIGRIQQICADNKTPCHIYPRPEYARAICGTVKTNDAIIRRALITRFGGDKKGEPLYLLKGASDKRSAFAVAVYHCDKSKLQNQP